MRCAIGLLSLAIVALLPWAPAQAQAPKEVVVGVLYPLSGRWPRWHRRHQRRQDGRRHHHNGGSTLNLPLGKTAGLPGLGRAKIRLVIVDHQGKPDVGQAEAERLITQEKVHALFGAYFSSVTATASQVAERYGTPYLNAESSSPGLTERGFKWFFRTSPHDGHFSVAMFDFMKELEKRRG